MNDWSGDYETDDGYDDGYGGDDGEDWEAETVDCPECGVEVYEDVAMCPACGAFVTAPRPPGAGFPRWFIVLGLIGSLLTAFVLVAG